LPAPGFFLDAREIQRMCGLRAPCASVCGRRLFDPPGPVMMFPRDGDQNQVRKRRIPCVASSQARLATAHLAQQYYLLASLAIAAAPLRVAIPRLQWRGGGSNRPAPLWLSESRLAADPPPNDRLVSPADPTAHGGPAPRLETVRPPVAAHPVDRPYRHVFPGRPVGSSLPFPPPAIQEISLLGAPPKSWRIDWVPECDKLCGPPAAPPISISAAAGGMGPVSAPPRC